MCIFYYKQKERKNVDNRLIIMRRDSTRFATGIGIDANTQFLDLIFLIFATANDQVRERETVE